MKKAILYLALISTALISCSKTKFIATNGKDNDEHYSPKHIVVFMSPDEIPNGTERVGIITSHKKKETKAFKKAKKLAASNGGNALLFTEGKEVSGGGKVANTFLWPGLYKAKWKFFVLHLKTDSTATVMK